MELLKRNIGFLLYIIVAIAAAVLLVLMWLKGRTDGEELRKKVKSQQDFFNEVRRISYSLDATNEKIAADNRLLAEQLFKGLANGLADTYNLPVEAASGVECKRKVLDMCRRFRRELDTNNVTPPADPAFSFDTIVKATTLPLSSDIPLILKQLRLVEAIVTLVAKSGITNFKQLARQQGLKGLERDLYVLYPVELQVDGDFAAINHLINLLQQQDTKPLGIVRSVTLESQDQAKGGTLAAMGTPAAGSISTSSSTADAFGGPGGQPDMAPMTAPAPGPVPRGKTGKAAPAKASDNLLSENKDERLMFKPHAMSATIVVDFVEVKKLLEEK